MKSLILLLLSVLSYTGAFAQDKFLLRNGEEMLVKVLEISPDSVLYTAFPDSAKSKIMALPKGAIFFIAYQNGTKEVMPEPAAPAPPKPSEGFLYAMGRTDAKKLYNAEGVFWASFATSAAFPIGGPLLGIPTGAVLSAVNVTDKNIKTSNPEYKQSPSYLKGYQKQAKMKKLGNAAAGVGVGTGLLLGVALILINSYH